MTLYYVRASMGNDGNTGLSAAQAFLTIDNAANTVAAGDTVYIGAGVYRETVTIDTSGSAGSEIKWIGDIDGVQTGDPGLVVITTQDAEAGGAGTGSTLDLNAKKWNEFYYVVFGPGGTGSTDYTIDASVANCNYEGVLFDTCVIMPPVDYGNYAINWNYKVPGAISGNKPKFTSCTIFGSLNVLYEAMAAGDVACGLVFENGLVIADTVGINLDGPSSSTDGIEGYEINNNVLFASTYGLQILNQFNTGDTGVAANNIQLSNFGSCVTKQADGGTWTLTNNQKAMETAETGGTVNCTNILGFMVDPIMQKFFGWSPYKAFEPVYDQNGGGFESGCIDAGNATYAPATDIYGNPRPMGRNVDDVGAGEARKRLEQETGTVRTGTYSGVLKGIGYHPMMLPVDAAETTVTVYAQYDGNYTGTLPTLKVVKIPGDTDKSDVQAGASGSFEQLSCTFTPTEAGFVEVQLWSYDTSADGECYFDDVVVS